MSFESELAAGRFRIPECAGCRRAVWPPAGSCPACLGGVGLRAGDPGGTVVECSARDGRRFGLVDFGGGVRLIAGLGGAREGDAVRITACGIRGGRWFFEAG